jgi:hypothetical protein
MYSEENLDLQILNSSVEDIRKNVVYFSKKKNKRILAKIIEISKIDLNFLDNSGYSTLHHSCYRGFRDITSLLLYYGCRNDLLNSENETAVQAGLYALKKKTSNEENIKYCIELIQKFKPVRNVFKSEKYISNLKSLVNKLTLEKQEKISSEIYNIIDQILYDYDLINEFLKYVLIKSENDKFYNEIYSKIIYNILIKNIVIKKIVAEILFNRYEEVITQLDTGVIIGYINTIHSLYKEQIIKFTLIEKLFNKIINLFNISKNLDYIIVICYILNIYDASNYKKINDQIIQIYKNIPSNKFKFKFKMEDLFKSKGIKI